MAEPAERICRYPGSGSLYHKLPDAAETKLRGPGIYYRRLSLIPGTVHIDEEKDFTPVIEKALELGGYQEDQAFYRNQRRQLLS